MIFCIPASEFEGVDSAFEGDFNRATNMVVFNDETREAWDVPIDSSGRGTGIPVHFNVVLCRSISRDVWSHYLQIGIRFFGVEARTVSEAIERYSKGDITAAKITASSSNQRNMSVHAMSGCGCGRHAHRHQPMHHACSKDDGLDPVHESDRTCCGGHGKRVGGCGCA